MQQSNEITDGLIKQLEALSTETRLPLEKRLVDTAVWFHKNKARIPRENLGARVDFIEKTFDIFIEMMALSVDRMQMMAGREKSANLWLPSGIVDKDTGQRYG